MKSLLILAAVGLVEGLLGPFGPSPPFPVTGGRGGRGGLELENPPPLDQRRYKTCHTGLGVNATAYSLETDAEFELESKTESCFEMVYSYMLASGTLQDTGDGIALTHAYRPIIANATAMACVALESVVSSLPGCCDFQCLCQELSTNTVDNTTTSVCSGRLTVDIYGPGPDPFGPYGPGPGPNPYGPGPSPYGPGPYPYGPYGPGPNPYGPGPDIYGPYGPVTNPYGPGPDIYGPYGPGPNPYGPYGPGPNPHGPGPYGPNPYGPVGPVPNPFGGQGPFPNPFGPEGPLVPEPGSVFGSYEDSGSSSESGSSEENPIGSGFNILGVSFGVSGRNGDEGAWKQSRGVRGGDNTKDLDEMFEKL